MLLTKPYKITPLSKKQLAKQQQKQHQPHVRYYKMTFPKQVRCIIT